MELYAQVVAELLQVAGVGLVVDVSHPNVQGLYRKTWVLYARALGQHFEQQERVLTAR